MAAKKVSEIKVGIQTGTDRTLYATWKWTRSNTENYSVKWYYATGDKVWFVGNESNTKEKQSIYSPPANAKQVKVKIKPISKTHKVEKKDVAYWTGEWSTEVKYRFSPDNTPEVPPVPEVIVKKYTLTAEVDVYDSKTDIIEFQVVQDNQKNFGNWKIKKTKNHAEFTCKINAGHKYKVRCRGLNGNLKNVSEKGSWSEYSGSVDTIPGAVERISSCNAITETSVRLEWSSVSNAEGYEIEYTSNSEWFDSSDEVQSMSLDLPITHAEILGLETGREYFFRVRATNSQGESGWCLPVSIVLGRVPEAPTTWSETTTAVVGEEVLLYWVHNSEDGSSQTYAEIELIIDGVSKIETVKTSTDKEERDKTSWYVLSTSELEEGATIQWRVRTKGVIDRYGDWSTTRTIDVFAPPVLSLTLSGTHEWYWDTFNFEKDSIYTAYGDLGEPIGTLTAFPLYVFATVGPASQTPVSYYVTIVAHEAYRTIDSVGNERWVNDGEEIFSKHYDSSDSTLFVALMANDLDLENNVTYTVCCKVSMNSGLTAEASSEFTVAWKDEQYEPDAEISIDEETFTAYIKPYCEDENGNLISDVFLAVYRREFDGSFTELASGLNNLSGTTITDPHPALDYARYRIVAASQVTGAISYYDLPGYPVGGIAVILQWDEEWISYNLANEDAFEKPTWTGSMLKLPYNIDVSDNYGVDVSLVEYIGRKHPVSYYGTQLGQTSTWNVEIASDDKETLYALRCLASWTGNVYVREPSGSGYWAQVGVSFSQKHCEVTIPVTLNITRVEGGI